MRLFHSEHASGGGEGNLEVESFVFAAGSGDLSLCSCEYSGSTIEFLDVKVRLLVGAIVFDRGLTGATGVCTLLGSKTPPVS